MQAGRKGGKEEERTAGKKAGSHHEVNADGRTEGKEGGRPDHCIQACQEVREVLKAGLPAVSAGKAGAGRKGNKSSFIPSFNSFLLISSFILIHSFLQFLTSFILHSVIHSLPSLIPKLTAFSFNPLLINQSLL